MLLTEPPQYYRSQLSYHYTVHSFSQLSHNITSSPKINCSTTSHSSWCPHCKDTIPKILKENIPRKGFASSQSQFPHSCVCEQFTYSHNRSAYSAAGKYVDRSWNYINRSQTHVEIGAEAAHFLFCEYINGIFVAVHFVSSTLWNSSSEHQFSF